MATVAFSIVRKQFSAFVRRAEAGEEIVITRRGKLHARLIPPDRDAFQADDNAMGDVGNTRR